MRGERAKQISSFISILKRSGDTDHLKSSQKRQARKIDIDPDDLGQEADSLTCK